MTGTGELGQSCRVLASTNVSLPMSSWTEVGSGTFAGGVFSFTDTNAAKYPKRFYRVVFSPASAPPGFTLQSVSVDYQWPYDLNLSSRHSGTFPGLEHFWVYDTDKPFQVGSTTNPRTEGIPSPRWTSGRWKFEGDLMVPTGTTGVNVMQVFGADPSIGATSCMLRTYNGNLSYYQTPLVTGIYDQWFHITVIHDDNLHTVSILVNNALVRVAPDNDAGNHPTHYFKYGVYQEAGASSLTECYWQNVKVWYAP